MLKVIALLKPLGLLALSAALSSISIAQTTPIKTVQVSDNIHLLYGQGGNVAVLTGEDGVIMVDDQFAVQVPLLREAVAKITGAPMRFVLNTHWHFDHTGGNELMGKADVTIVAHDNVRQRMSTEQFITHFKKTVPPSPAEALPVITFSDKASFHLNGEQLRLIHAPHAHTDGDSLVHFQTANVLHMGDIFFNGKYPFIDISAGGNLKGVIKAVQLGLSLTDSNSKIIPGHGELTNQAGLQSYLNMLTGVRDTVQGLIDKGMTREQVIAAGPTQQWDAELGNDFIKPAAMAGFVYDSLVQ